MTRSSDALPDIASLVPHRPPMLLLDAIERHDSESLTARVWLREDSPFVVGNGLPGIVMLEYMAQAVAAYSGLWGQGGSRVGYLVGVRRLELAEDHVPVGQLLLVTARHLWSNHVSGSFDGSVEAADALLAHARLSVFVPGAVQGTRST